MKRRSETPRQRLRRTESKLATANRRLARIRAQRIEAARMRPVYQLVGLLAQVVQDFTDRQMKRSKR